MRRLLLLSLAAAVPWACQAHAPASGARRPADTETVGRRGANRTVLPVNQVVTPLGVQVELPGLRPQALALSPDGRHPDHRRQDRASSSSWTRPPAPSASACRSRRRRRDRPGAVGEHPRARQGRPAQLHRPALLPGRPARVPERRQRVRRRVRRGGRRHDPRRALDPPARGRAPPGARRRSRPASPCRADGTRLYVCGNLSNTLLEVAVADGRVLRAFDVGVAPYDVVLTGGKAYVSNWGGRRPLPGEPTGPAGRGTEVKVDPVRHVASEGSVTVIDLAVREAAGRDRDRAPRERPRRVAGRPPRRLRERGERHPQRDRHADRHRGRDDLGEAEPGRPLRRPAQRARLRPLRPDALRRERHAERRRPSSRSTRRTASRSCRASSPSAGSPARSSSTPRAARSTSPTSRATPRPRSPTRRRRAPGAAGFNSHHYHGSLSLVPVPEARELPALSETVWRNLRRERIAEALLPPRPGQPARAVPERIGEPSLIKHVVYVIKENRTYDQVLGDVEAGNGDPRAVHLRRADHPQPAQARARVRPARQHLLRRHPQRRRPPVEHDRDRHRLPGALLRRLAAQLSRRHGRGRGRRPRLLPRRLPLGQRAPPRRPHPQLRRVHGARGEVARPEEEGHARLPRQLPHLEGRERRGRLRERPDDRDHPAVLAHGVRRVGDGRARPVPGRLHPRGARRSSRPGASSRSSRSSACPTTTRAARARAPPPRRRPWPTTTSPSAGSSRP